MGRARKLIIPAIAAMIGLAILLNLGFWQVRRLAEKETLIEQVEAGLKSAAVAAPGVADWDGLGDEDDYRRVSVTGRFLDQNVFYYLSLTDPVGTYGGPGELVYSPFETADGWTVLINRGFLPDGVPDDIKRQALTPPTGGQTLVGLLRLSETPVWTTPAPDLNAKLWFARDTAAMAEAMNVGGNLAPYSIDLEAVHTPEGGLPQAGETLVRFKNDHLGYALTWFGLAATLVGVFLAYAAAVLWPRKQEHSANVD
ncbi:SURF1 family protein [Roseibium alexandrii]|uniref:SURF1 family protein n=1 Tax=Roseibium alexandrii TaxID=388408 RepID=UPI0037531E11